MGADSQVYQQPQMRVVKLQSSSSFSGTLIFAVVLAITIGIVFIPVYFCLVPGLTLAALVGYESLSLGFQMMVGKTRGTIVVNTMFNEQSRIFGWENKVRCERKVLNVDFSHINGDINPVQEEKRDR